MSGRMEIFQPQQPFQPNPLNVWQSGLMQRKCVAEKEREVSNVCMLYCTTAKIFQFIVILTPSPANSQALGMQSHACWLITSMSCQLNTYRQIISHYLFFEKCELQFDTLSKIC